MRSKGEMRGELSTDREVDQRKTTDRVLLFNISLLETNQKRNYQGSRSKISVKRVRL
jgi:hypothetical protein